MTRSRCVATVVLLASGSLAMLVPLPVSAAPKITESSVLTRLRSKDPLVRIEVAADIENAGLKNPRIAEALTDSILRDDNSYVREFTAGALSYMRDQAVGDVPRVIAILTNASLGESRRARAAQILGAVGMVAPASITPLAEVLEDRGNSEELRESAAVALTYFGRLPPGGVAARIEPVAFGTKENPKLRALSIEVLANTGPDGANAIPSLESLLSDRGQNLQLRERAAYALGRISSDAQVSYPVKTLTAVLTDTAENADLRTAAAQALENIRTSASEVLPALCRIASERGAPTRLQLATLVALQQVGQGTRGCAAELLRLAESNAPIEVRVRAAQTMGSVGSNESDQIELVKLAENRLEPPELRRAAIGSVRLQNPTPTTIAKALLRILRDPEQDPQVRKLAAQRAAGIRPLPKAFVEVFGAIIANRHEDIDLRRGTAYAAGTAGSAAVGLVPVLTQAVAKSTDLLLRRGACSALLSIRRGGKPTLEVLQNIVSTQRADPELRRTALQALGAIASDDKDEQATVIPMLLRVLVSSQDTQMRQSAAAYLGQIDPRRSKALADLSDVAANQQEDLQVRQSAVSAIGQIGHNYEVTVAVPTLVRILGNPDERLQLRQTAANALSAIRPPVSSAIPVLIHLAEVPIDDQLGQSVISALGYVGQDSDGAAAFLAKIVQDSDRTTNLRASAAVALGRTGLAARPYEQALLSALNVADIAPAALQGVRLLAEDAADDGDATSIPFLKRVVKLASANPALANARDRDKTYVEMIRSDIAILERHPTTPRKSWLTLSIDTVVAHPLASALILLWPLWSLLTWLTLWCKPALLVPLSDFASKGDGKLDLGTVKVPWRFIVLVPRLQYHPKSLDAWVTTHAASYRERFLGLQTVRDRELYVDLPVYLGQRTVPHFGPTHLEDALARSRTAILVTGEGGAGKTSLASQIARWAMAEDRHSRLSQHTLLPVLIEGELGPTDPNRMNSLEEAVRGHLRHLLEKEEPPSAEMVRSLLRNKRILVFVDGYSEMNDADRAKVAPADPAFSCNALLITSRNKESLHGIDVTEIQPAPLSKGSLSSFVERYLVRLGKPDAFGKEAFQKQVGSLQGLVGERDVTPLFVKLYIDLVVNADTLSGAPTSIPDLVLRYLNHLNRNVGVNRLEDDELHLLAERVAERCVAANFRPAHAGKQDVLDALGGGSEARVKLNYLDKVLGLVQVIDPGEHVRFRLDPIAEYLAALDLTGRMNGNNAEWAQLFREMDHAEAGPANAHGFLQALRDCYVFRHAPVAAGDFVLAELDNRLAGLRN